MCPACQREMCGGTRSQLLSPLPSNNRANPRCPAATPTRTDPTVTESFSPRPVIRPCTGRKKAPEGSRKLPQDVWEARI